MSRVEKKGLTWNGQMKKGGRDEGREREGKGERRKGGEKFNRTEEQSGRREAETPYGITSGDGGSDD